MQQISKQGIHIEYGGKKYISLHSLCDDLGLPYSEVSHRYNKTKDIEQSVEWGKELAERKRGYVIWGQNYGSLSQIANAFGVNLGSMRARMDQEKKLEDIISGLLQKETIFFEGKEYHGISELSVAYGHDPSLVLDRLYNGQPLERALKQGIREICRPEFEIEYHGRTYDSKRSLCRELGITYSNIHEMVVNNHVDFETAVDIFREVKERVGIPKERMISWVPVCIINGKWYKTVVELCTDYKVSQSTIASYKNRHGYTGVLETLQAMQKETKPGYVYNGEVKTSSELEKMGIWSQDIKKLPKTTMPLYPQLSGYDFVTNCVDVIKIYTEVKEEKLNSQQEQEMHLTM